jgi:hypothetical protein
MVVLAVLGMSLEIASSSGASALPEHPMQTDGQPVLWGKGNLSRTKLELKMPSLEAA